MATQGSGISVENILPWISAVGVLVIIWNTLWPHLCRLARWSISVWRSYRNRRRARQSATAEQFKEAARQQLVDDTVEALTRLRGMEQRPVGDFHYLEWRRQAPICKHLLLDVLREYEISVRSDGWKMPPFNINVRDGMWMILWGSSRYDRYSVIVAVRWWDAQDVEFEDSTLVLRKRLTDGDLRRMGWTPYRGWKDGDTSRSL